MNSRDETLTERHSPSSAAARALAFALFLYVAWIGAWLLERFLEAHVVWMTASTGRSGYWLVMKLLLWILPALALIRSSGRSFREVIALDRARPIVVWGGGCGLILGAMALIAKALAGRPMLPSSLGWPLFSGVLVAPVAEEIVFRGAILGALNERFRFWAANAITGLLFLGVHLPGWYFQGRLFANLVDPIGGALAVFLLGLVFGYVAHRSESVAASMLTHMLNNLFHV